MATDNSTSAALQHQAILNQQFAQNFAPLNNFVSQNASLAIAQEKMRQEQAYRLAALQFENQLAMQRQQAQAEAQLNLSKFVHKAADDQQLKIAQLNIAHQDNRIAKEQADKIRMDQTARRVLKDEIAKQPDTPEGNRALVAAYTKAFSDPDVMENLNLDTAEGVAKEIKSVLGNLSSSFSNNSANTRRAVQQFIATPGVADMLTKKGKMSAAEVSALLESGDPTKVKGVIDQVAREAAWFGQDRDVLSQLVSAWSSALAETGAATSPDQVVQAGYLKTLMTRFDESTRGLSKPESWKKLTSAYGMGAAPKNVLPPPTTGLATPQTKTAAPTNTNPFPAPADPTSGKIGLGKIGTPTAMSKALAAAARDDTVRDRMLTRAGAFAPPRLAEDPHTELALRSRILQNAQEESQMRSNLWNMIPFVTPTTPTYDVGTQVRDQETLEALVRGLHGIK